METKTVSSTGCWYHISSGTGDSAARWAQGAARKGNWDGKMNLSAVLFDAGEIAEALPEGSWLIGADLVLRRDAAFGDAAVSVSVAPARIGSIGERYMSRSQCLEMALRDLHKNHTVQGATASFPLPGATLAGLADGSVNAFLLYQEEDGTGSYCRLSSAAELKLYVCDAEAPGWIAPVWTREIRPGDLICGKIYSHAADLRELETYVNIRRLYNGLARMDEITDIGPYESWADVIGALQEGADGFLEEEGRIDPGGHYAWTEPEEGALPDAGILNQLRDVLRGGDENRITATGFTASLQLGSATADFRISAKMNWESGTPAAGYMKTSRTIWQGGVQRTVTTWDAHVCGWIFSRDESLALDSAAVELLVTAAETERPHITLYGIAAAQAPGRASYAEVFHAEPIAEADVSVGEAVKIYLSAQGLSLMSAGTIHGVGLRYDNNYVQLAQEAALVINEETEDASE